MPHFPVVQLFAAAVVFAAAATDLRSRRIPNWLTLSGIAIGLLLNGTLGGASGIRSALGGMALGFGCYFFLYCLRAMGAGDVKLMAAVGAIVGPSGWIAVFLASAAAAGLLSLALVVWKRRARETFGNTLLIAKELVHLRPPWERHRHLDVKDPRALNMPHAVAIAAGTTACLFLAVI
jgi:prepilin peptidase CpaA